VTAPPVHKSRKVILVIDVGCWRPVRKWLALSVVDLAFYNAAGYVLWTSLSHSKHRMWCRAQIWYSWMSWLLPPWYVCVCMCVSKCSSLYMVTPRGSNCGRLATVCRRCQCCWPKQLTWTIILVASKFLWKSAADFFYFTLVNRSDIVLRLSQSYKLQEQINWPMTRLLHAFMPC